MMLISIVVPPLGEPTLPNLAADLLATMARSSGHHARVLHSPLMAPQSFAKFIVDGVVGPGIFAPFYYGSDSLEDEMRRLAEAMQDDIELTNRNGRFAAPVDGHEVLDHLYLAASEVPSLVSSITEKILDPEPPDLIAITVPFDKDKLPAAAIAKEMRARGYGGPIVCGGTALGVPMAHGFLKSFPEIDYVVSGEAEESWPRLLRAVGAGEAVEAIPGLSWRQDDDILSTPLGPLTDTFMTTPGCDWSAYLAQREGTRWANKPLTLMAESSRGCWWGAKHQCRFCSVSMADHPYRAKGWRRVVEEFVTLYDAYQPDIIMTSDAVLSHRDMITFLQALRKAREERPWNIFYEVRSTYGRRTIARLASAGITTVQPGIESFSSMTLSRMNKGAKGIQQLNFLKWSTAYRMSSIYCVMCGTPGETPEEILYNRDVMRRIHHYQPATVHGLYLFRGSPYDKDPGAYGFQDLDPGSLARFMYRNVDPSGMVHNMLYDMPEHRSAEYEDAVEEVRREGYRWEENWNNGTFSTRFRLGNDSSFVWRGQRTGSEEADLLPLNENETLLLDALEEPRSLRRVLAETGMSPADFDGIVDRLSRQDLLYVEQGYGLSLPIPSEASVEDDAAWDAISEPCEELVLSSPCSKE